MIGSVSVRVKNERVEKNAFKHSYTVECGNRLRVEVRAKDASVSGLRVGRSKFQRSSERKDPFHHDPLFGKKRGSSVPRGGNEKVSCLETPQRGSLLSGISYLSCQDVRDFMGCSQATSRTASEPIGLYGFFFSCLLLQGKAKKVQTFW